MAPQLSLTNLRIGNARLGLRFRRDGSGYTHHEIIDQQGQLRIHRPVMHATGVDRCARYVQEIASG